MALLKEGCFFHRSFFRLGRVRLQKGLNMEAEQATEAGTKVVKGDRGLASLSVTTVEKKKTRIPSGKLT